MSYYIIPVNINEKTGRGVYDGFIKNAGPVIEKHGGRQYISCARAMPHGGCMRAAHVLVLEFESRTALQRCLASEDMRRYGGHIIKEGALREEKSVKSGGLLLSRAV